MLKTRVISAVVLLPIVLVILYLGGWPYEALVGLATVLAGYEYVQMLARRGYELHTWLVMALIIAWEIGELWPAGDPWVPMVLFMVVGAFPALVRSQRDGEGSLPVEHWALMLAGSSYLGLGGRALIHLRRAPDGLWWTFLTCLIVWVGDSAAYFVGRRWGRHKIAPRISPGKSWEGYLAQVLAGTLLGGGLGALGASLVHVPSLALAPGLGLGFLVSLLCPGGDFLVSMIKREVGVKDTGALIPGHGGMFDRLDSLLWAGVLASLLVGLIV